MNDEITQRGLNPESNAARSIRSAYGTQRRSRDLANNVPIDCVQMAPADPDHLFDLGLLDLVLGFAFNDIGDHVWSQSLLRFAETS